MRKGLTVSLLLLCCLGLLFVITWDDWRSQSSKNLLAAVTRSEDLNALLQGQTKTDNELTESIDLALRGVDLAQGETGFEQWRLQAEWAALRQASGTLEVRLPHVQYALGEKPAQKAAGTAASPNMSGALVAAAPNKTDNALNTDITSNASNADNTDITGKPESADKNASQKKASKVDVTSEFGLVYDQNTKIRLSGNVNANRGTDTVRGALLNYDDTTRTVTFPNRAKLEGERLSADVGALSWDLKTNIMTGSKGVALTWIPAASVSPAVPEDALTPLPERQS